MGKILKLIQAFQKLDIDKVSQDSLSVITPEIEEAQRYQLTHGLSSTGGTLRKYRSAAYARKKNQMNPAPGLGNPDLKLTGAFHNKIEAKITREKVILHSTDEKALQLEAEYGQDKIYGLQPEEKAMIVNEKLRPTFNKNIRTEVGL